MCVRTESSCQRWIQEPPDRALVELQHPRLLRSPEVLPAASFCQCGIVIEHLGLSYFNNTARRREANQSAGHHRWLASNAKAVAMGCC